MNIHEWLCILPQFCILLPISAFCYLPMKNQMKYSLAKTTVLCGIILIPYIFFGAWLCVFLQTDTNIILLPSLIVFFLLYRHTVKTDLSRTLAVYINICLLQTFPAQFSYAFDAWLNPDSGAIKFSAEAALFQLGISCLLMAVLAYPAYRWFAWMIDHLNFPKIWYSTLVLSSIFFVLNFHSVPRSYNILYMGRIYHLFLLLETGALAILLFLYVTFYHMAVVILECARLEERSHFLEMQAHQYQTLQEHMWQTKRLRHDFRHSIHLLAALAEQGDLDSIRIHLAEYENQLEELVSVNYCTNTALNALFGYYHEMAALTKIKTDWKLNLPETLTVSELDMASLFGNIMENAIAGCQTVPEDARYFSLTTEIQHGNTLYIVSTNSFDGCIKKGQNGYLSTKHNGKGIGLRSIATVAEKYRGFVQVSNDDKHFFVDVMIKL